MIARTEAAGRIIDVMTGGNFDWRSRLDESDFLNSADWHTALAYADAALSAPAVAIGAGEVLAWRYTRPNSVYPELPEHVVVEKASNRWTAANGWTETPLSALAPASASIPADVEREALAGYRAAVSFIAADAWDGCSDCIEVLRAAREADWQNDQAADPNETARQLARIRALAARPSTGEREA